MHTLLVLPVAPFAIVLLLVISLTIRSIFSAALDPLRSIPGPLWSRFSRLWYLANVWDGHFEKTNIQLHKKLGSVVRIAPGQYSIDDPEAIRIIYGHGTKFTKAPWYQASAGSTEVQDIFTDRNPQRHANSRRKVASLYSMSTLTHFEPMLEHCSDILGTRLREFAQLKTRFDLQHWLQCYAFDVIAVITLDKRFGFLDEGKDIRRILHGIHHYLIYCANVGVYAEWHSTARALIEKIMPGDGGAGMVTFVQQELAERRDPTNQKNTASSDRADFLTTALKMHGNDPEKFSMMDVFVICMTNIGAGSDTTSISLTAIMYYLMKSPDKLQTLREELDQAVATGAATTPITFQQAQNLPYLQACIKEGLRLHPATGLPLARVVPPEGATIATTFFPGGTIVGINTWVAHRNQSVFGPDADAFSPERWLESKEKASQMDQYYFPFGLGSRTCIGKNISLMEISKLVPELVRRFDFKLVHPERELETENVWFVKQKNLECTVSLRSG